MASRKETLAGVEMGALAIEHGRMHYYVERKNCVGQNWTPGSRSTLWSLGNGNDAQALEEFAPSL